MIALVELREICVVQYLWVEMREKMIEIFTKLIKIICFVFNEKINSESEFD